MSCLKDDHLFEMLHGLVVCKRARGGFRRQQPIADGSGPVAGGGEMQRKGYRHRRRILCVDPFECHAGRAVQFGAFNFVQLPVEIVLPEIGLY
mgnify:CR=1 FL=1